MAGAGLLFGAAAGGSCQCCGVPDCGALPSTIYVTVSGISSLGCVEQPGGGSTHLYYDAGINAEFACVGNAADGWLNTTQDTATRTQWGTNDCSGEGGGTIFPEVWVGVLCGDGGDGVIELTVAVSIFNQPLLTFLDGVSGGPGSLNLSISMTQQYSPPEMSGGNAVVTTSP
jgi:hypothetical protein